MGDLFFVIKITIYTVFLVLLMQVKIGETTVEERVIEWTHTSSFSTVIKDMAEGGVRMVGVGYNNLMKEMDSDVLTEDNAPGKRLEKKLKSTKSYLQKQFSAQDSDEQSDEQSEE